MATVRNTRSVSLFSIVLPAVVAAAFAAGIAGQLGYFQPRMISEAGAPETVTIPGGPFEYRDYGEFYKNGFAVDAPMVRARTSASLTIMKYQVSEGEYARCVDAGKCKAVEAAHVHGAGFPVTGIDFDDAQAYARWLSSATGEVWRLPSQDQMAFAARSKFPDDGLGVDPNNRNPALRWLADYDRETRRKAVRDRAPKERGHFGENEFGLADFAGNVWEWTTTCQRRVDLANTRRTTASTCGIYVTVGQHRSPMSSFVRDPKTGGCSVGAPPANLGFRLVKDERWYAGLLRRLRERGIIS